MASFRKNRKCSINANVKVEDVYVVTAIIISSHNNGAGCGPRCVDMFFLAKYEYGEYYELFSGKKLEKEKIPENGFLSKSFDTPYVRNAKPLAEYLRDKSKKEIDIQLLFDFIINKNVFNFLEAVEKEGVKEHKEN